MLCLMKHVLRDRVEGGKGAKRRPDLLQELRVLYERGAVRPVVNATFSFGEAQAALAAVHAGGYNGKIALRGTFSRV